MKTELRLANPRAGYGNAGFETPGFENKAASGKVAQQTGNARKASIAPIRALVPAQVTILPVTGKQAYVSGWLLILVLLAHLLVFLLLISLKPEVPVIEQPATPMMVSLINNPSPIAKSEFVPEKLPEAKPIVPKLQPVLQPRPQPASAVNITTPVLTVAATDKSSAEKASAEPAQVSTEPTQQTASPVIAKVADQPLPKDAPVIEPPRFGAAYLNNPAPAYPNVARRAGEQGRTVLRVLVTESGDAGSVSLEQGSGSDRLDQAAIDAVKKWRFVPARQNNRAVSAYVLVPLKFSLEN